MELEEGRIHKGEVESIVELAIEKRSVSNMLVVIEKGSDQVAVDVDVGLVIEEYIVEVLMKVLVAMSMKEVVEGVQTSFFVNLDRFNVGNLFNQVRCIGEKEDAVLRKMSFMARKSEREHLRMLEMRKMAKRRKELFLDSWSNKMCTAAKFNFRHPPILRLSTDVSIVQYGSGLSSDNIVNIIFSLLLIRSITFRTLLCLSPKYSPSVSSESYVCKYN